MFGTHTIFSEAETIFFASESGFSLTEKIVGDVPTIFVELQPIISRGVLCLTASELRTGSPDSLLNSSLPWPAHHHRPYQQNTAFPAPTVDLKAVQAAVDDLNTALTAQPRGGTAATAEKKNKQEALISLLSIGGMKAPFEDGISSHGFSGPSECSLSKFKRETWKQLGPNRF